MSMSIDASDPNHAEEDLILHLSPTSRLRVVWDMVTLQFLNSLMESIAKKERF